MPNPDIVTDSQGRQKYRLQLEVEWAYPYQEGSPLSILWAPPGGVGQANLPFVVQGDDGKPPVLQTATQITEIEWDDPTPVTSTWVKISDGTGDSGPVYKEVKKVRKPQPGANGTSTLDPNAYGTKVAYRTLQLKSDLSGFEYTPQKVCGMHWAATTPAAAPDGTTAGYALTSVSIAANTYPFPVRFIPIGETVVIGSTADVVVDLVAHLNSAGGVVIGRCSGIGGVKERLTLAGVPDPGAVAADVTVAANAAAQVYLRSEKQSGTATYQTSAGATRFGVLAVAVP